MSFTSYAAHYLDASTDPYAGLYNVPVAKFEAGTTTPGNLRSYLLDLGNAGTPIAVMALCHDPGTDPAGEPGVIQAFHRLGKVVTVTGSRFDGDTVGSLR